MKLRGIYLHGYQGFVTEEKQNFLNDFGDIYAPFIDYEMEPDILFKLVDKFKNQKIDFVSGTSLGGILGYYLAKILNVPCLLFNPAVIAINQIKDLIPENQISDKYNKLTYVVVGLKDEVVDPFKQIDFYEDKPYTVIIKEDNLQHHIDLETFKKGFNDFLDKIL